MSGVLHGVIASLKAAAAAVDSFFEYVTLLLNTTSTNGAQNNTFLDASTNNFTITRNGDTTQGSFNPYMPSGYWSGYFDGNGDNLSVAHNVALNLSSGDFTVEAWVYWSGSNVNSTIFDKDGTFGSSYPSYQIAVNGSGFIRGVVGTGNSTASFQTITSNTLCPVNTWVHLAFVKNGTTLTLYQNGTSVASATQTATMTDGGKALLVGYSAGQPTSSYFAGYISNARIVKGTAVYTSAFTPPTTPLTAITNTSLLCLQDNRFKDNSTNNFTITRNGDTRISKRAPFNPPQSWDAATYGGSGYFDGTGDDLSLTNSAGLNPGTGDFTIECWVYPTGSLVNANFFTGFQSGISFGCDASGNLTVGDAYVVAIITTTTPPPLNQWSHVAAVRSGTTVSLYLNGTRLGTTTSSADLTTGTANYIGSNGNTSGRVYYTGYISNMRLVKGTAVYDPTQTTLTVPTAPLTAITNTSLLLNFTNAGIFDAATINDAQTVGNAQVSTTQAKFGTTSMYFDGTGDWLTIIDKPELRFGTAPFTVEFFVYLGATGAARGLVAKGTSTTGWLVSTDSSNKVVFTYTTSTITSTAALSGSQWYHIAVVREGTGSNQTKIYIDGTNDGTGTVSTDFNQTSIAYVGANRTGGDALNGYIDELRITNGYARYTANFTPPTAAFPTL